MASRGLNRVMLIGNLGKDAETRYTQNGTAITNFSIATPRNYKDGQGNWQEETDWHRIVLWKNENLAGYLTKGKRIYVEGRLQTRSWEDQNGNTKYTTEVVASQVLLLDGKSDGNGGGGRRQADPAPQSKTSGSMFDGVTDDYDGQGIVDDDVPF